MNNHRIIITALLTSTLLAACSTDDLLPALSEKGNAVQLSATLEEVKVVTRTGPEPVTPTAENPYYLYYTKSSSDATVPRKFENDFTTSSGIYWDDVKPFSETGKSNTAFQLTNVPSGGTYPSDSNKDIQWGEAKGWQTPLTFRLKHQMAQFSVILIDKTNNGQGSLDPVNPVYKDVNVLISGISKDAKSFDPTTGKVEATVREKEVVLYSKKANESGTPGSDGIKYASGPVYYPPQAFEQKAGIRDSLRITCGRYTYKVEVPQTMTGSTETTTALRAGEHLTLTITLKDEDVKLNATLAGWETVTAENMPLNRVFNIASLEELKDFALAVNTGFDFKGMIVRITKEISFTYSEYGTNKLLDNINIGTKSHPFRGIFDGNSYTITNRGLLGTNYSGSLFGYTDGATLRNIKFEAPYVKGQGALAAEANNSVILGCEINNGQIDATGECTGALVGKATGTTTLTNCYVTKTTVTGNGRNQIGGLVGSTEGSISHCFATGDVTGGALVGGLAGKTSGVVLNCYAWGNISGTDYVGGMIGMTQSSVRNSYAAGTVSGSNNEKGGLLGNIGFGGEVKYCFWNKAAFGPGTDDNKGGGAVNLNDTDICFGFDFISGTEDVLNLLSTGYPDTWQVSSGGNKPIFKYK